MCRASDKPLRQQGPSMHLPKNRLGIAAGVVAGSAGMALLAGLGPAQSLIPIASARGADDGRAHAQVDDHGDHGHGADDGVTATTGVPATGTQVVDAAGAGTVTVAVGADTLHVVAASPAAGFTARVEVANGREGEVEFRRGTQRAQVNLEIEDGMVPQRRRRRDATDRTAVRVEHGRIVDDNGAEDVNDDNGVDVNDDKGAEVNDDHGVDVNEGPSANAGPGSVTATTRVDSSGPGSGGAVVDDHGGHGADAPAGDDRGGHGADDPSGHH